MKFLALAIAVSVADLARGQEAALFEVDPRQEAYERADMAKHPFTLHVGAGYPDLPRVGADYLVSGGYSVSATLGAFVLLPSASLQLNFCPIENLGFRPYVAPAALGYVRTDTGELAVCPSIRGGFEFRGIGGDWFRAEIGAAYNTGSLPLPVVPLVAVARGFSLGP